MNTSTFLSKKEIQKMLDAFQQAYQKKEVTTRIPYKAWRAIHDSESIIVHDYGDRFEVIVANRTYEFDTKEKNGFVAFFRKRFYPEKVEKQNMAIDKNILTNMTISNKTAEIAYNDLTSTLTNCTSGYTYSNGTIRTNTSSANHYVIQSKYEDNYDYKEEKKMKGFNFDFGPCDSSKVHLSMYGIAVKNKNGEWVSYNSTSGDIINVDIFNIDSMTKFIYKMPVASNAVEVGDVIIHNGYPMFVQAIGEEFKSFDVVDVYAGESKTVIPTKNMFGFDVMTKVVSLFDATSMAPTADQPFGNMLPFLMMGDGKVDPMIMMMMMNQNGNVGNMFGNPMMMYLMMKDNKDIDPIVFMLMNNNSTCNCGKSRK